MYKRFLSGLTKPREIILYLKDSWLKVWVYLTLLAVLLTVPFFIAETTYTGFSSHEITQINSGFQPYLSGPYQIIDSKLIIPIENQNDFKQINITSYSINLINTNTVASSMITLNFEETGVNILFFNVLNSFETYESIGLTNFNFSDYSPANIQIFTNALQNLVSKYNIAIKAIYIGYVMLANILDIILITALVSFAIKSKLKFKHRFKLAVYNATIYAILVFYSNIFNMSFLTYVAMFIFLMRQKKTLSTIIMR